jgi:hypothetical protein
MRPVRYTWWLETGSIYLVAIGFSVDRCRGVDRLQRRFNERRRAVADTADFCDIAGSRLETGKPLYDGRGLAFRGPKRAIRPPRQKDPQLPHGRGQQLELS